MRLYGIIGNPLDDSPSPKFYNAFFKKSGLECRYLPFQVEERHLKNLVLCMKLCDVEGLNVTIPFKEKVIPFLDGLDKSAKVCGAVNTVVRKKNKFIGYNTDGVACLKVLKEKRKWNPKNKTIAIVGAGGAARGIAGALAGAGAKEICFLNRHSARAKKASRFLKKHFPRTKWLTFVPSLKIDLVVQTTPVFISLPKKILSKTAPTFDSVYTRNKKDGLQMLKAQAQLNLKLWGF